MCLENIYLPTYYYILSEHFCNTYLQTVAEKLPRSEPANLKLSPLFQANILQRSAAAHAQASTSRELSQAGQIHHPLHSPLAASVTKFLKCHDCPDRPFTSLEDLDRHVVGVHGKLYVSFDNDFL